MLGSNCETVHLLGFLLHGQFDLVAAFSLGRGHVGPEHEDVIGPLHELVRAELDQRPDELEALVELHPDNVRQDHPEGLAQDLDDEALRLEEDYVLSQQELRCSSFHDVKSIDD